MQILDYYKLALKSLLLNKVRSFLTMLGIIIGVGAVIILTSIVGGLERTITNQFKSFGSNSLFLFPGKPGAGRGPGGTVVNKLKFDYASKIAKVEGVDDVSTLVFNLGNITFRAKENKDATIYGVEDNYLKVTAYQLEAGRFITKGEVSGEKLVAVIGTTVVKNIFDTANPIGKEITIRGKKFTVIGVLKKQGAVFGTDQDNRVMIPITVSRTRFQIDKPSFFYIKVKDGFNIKAVQTNIEREIRQYLDRDEFSVLSQEQSLDFITTVLGILSTSLGGIAAISLLVGGVGIMNIMFVSVTERTREIGLRKAVGANADNILAQFLMEAIILSLVGGLFGVLFGIGASLLIGTFIDTAVSPMYIGISFVVSVAIGIIFGVAPAIKASKLDPIIALRYE